jgi:hypothetical protein
MKLSFLKKKLRYSFEQGATIRIHAKILTENSLTKKEMLKELSERKTDELKSKLWYTPKDGNHVHLKECESKVITLIFNVGKEKEPWFSRNEIVPRSPKPGLKQEFDLMDASEKVITLLSRIMMSNIWASCTPNIYGMMNKTGCNKAIFSALVS